MSHFTEDEISAAARPLSDFDFRKLAKSHASEFREAPKRTAGHQPSKSVSARGSNDSLLLSDLYSECDLLNWLPVDKTFTNDGNGTYSNHGVYLRPSDEESTQWPENLNPAVSKAFSILGVKAAFVMSSDITASVFSMLDEHQDVLIVNSDIQFTIKQRLSDIDQINNTKSDCPSDVCLIREERIVLVWAESTKLLIGHGVYIESKFMSLLWGAPISAPKQAYIKPPRCAESASVDHDYKMHTFTHVRPAYDDKELDEMDLDEEALKMPKRAIVLTHSVVVTLAVMLIVVISLNTVGMLLKECQYDFNYTRMLFTLVLLPQFVLSAFFFLIIVCLIYQAVGPLKDVKSNSNSYSSIKPKRYRHQNMELPHITIQMPVFREGLQGVIKPTCFSLLAAIEEYESQGGTASVFINDDGLQVVKQEHAEERIGFYQEHNIGYCARPGHGKDGFERKGKFKKASNMNYALYTSTLVEDKFAEIKATAMHDLGMVSEDDVTWLDEEGWYKEALAYVVEQSEGRTIAGGNIRIGEIILIVDSDTRVPLDCLINAAMEMAESPEVAIIQHGSGVMQIVHNTFEDGIAYFTNLVYDAIEYNVGSGDFAPFVGHNAFLRWKAVQSVAFHEGDKLVFWSESHVSEDFDLSLRLQTEGFTTRLATYHNGEFKEGVSLTVFDELSRWEKYAYGCSELIWNPVHQWIFKGPITKLFYKFLLSNTRMTSKITLLAYLGTYYALGAALPLTILNYFLYGWVHGSAWLDEFYTESWRYLLPLVLVFQLASPTSYAILRARLEKKAFGAALLQSMRWTPMLVIFFGGLSWHLLLSIGSHMFNISREWGGTAKEVEASGYYVGFDKIVKGFKWMYLFMVPLAGTMVYLAFWAPFGWIITQPTTVIPLAISLGSHMILPVVLGNNLF